MRDEGYIKYQCDWTQMSIPKELDINEINSWRSRLFEMGLIGVYPDGIGFGNISQRISDKQFLVTGSATGGLKSLDQKHYSLVTSFEAKRNLLSCIGMVKASSESMTHGTIYRQSTDIQAVIHVHSKPLWLQLMSQVPTTRKEVQYGTPDMAEEVKRLFQETDVVNQKILVMAGHEEGIITFGKDLDEAGQVLLGYIQAKW
ncbi:MAG: class II aldolase/adducin family protein [Cyclobacteriaceae bacterium]|nr:class II aldolase/adducin family protein [Cyclobacteriaceae bacterium HetDA_MAG_MS6]